jgi:Predicted nucleic-acid-binding protein containing a Zn-ribbon
MKGTVKRVSLEPGVFRVTQEEGGDVLLGSRCRVCRRTFFPPRAWCAACCTPTCEEVELSREGTLESYTVVHRKSAYALVETPYILGEVAIPEGIRIYTTINLRSWLSEDGTQIQNGTDTETVGRLMLGQEAQLRPVVIKKDERVTTSSPTTSTR